VGGPTSLMQLVWVSYASTFSSLFWWDRWNRLPIHGKTKAKYNTIEMPIINNIFSRISKKINYIIIIIIIIIGISFSEILTLILVWNMPRLTCCHLRKTHAPPYINKLIKFIGKGIGYQVLPWMIPFGLCSIV
jgi:hypothetical protein